MIIPSGPNRSARYHVWRYARVVASGDARVLDFRLPRKLVYLYLAGPVLTAPLLAAMLVQQYSRASTEPTDSD